MFGRDKDSNKDKDKERLQESFSGEYMGGHTMFPKKHDADTKIFKDHLEISFGSVHKNSITIPYQAITNLSSEDEARITKTRILLTPLLIGLLWKKKFRYSVIDYSDTFDIKQTVIIDYHRHAQQAQQAIYSKMIEFKTKEKLN